MLPLLVDLAALPAAFALTPIGNPIPATVTLVLIMAVVGSYRAHLTLSALDEVPRMLAASLVAGVVTTLAFVPAGSAFDAIELATASLAFVTMSRTAAYAVERRLRRNPRHRQRTVIVGGGTVASILAEAIADGPASGLELVGILDEIPRASDQGSPAPSVAGDLRTVITSERIETVLLAFTPLDDSDTLRVLRECDRLDCEIYVVPRLWEMTAMTGDMERLGAVPLRRIRRTAHRSLRWGIKLWMGRLIAAAAMAFLAPALLVTATAVWLSDRSAPILFRQKRITMDGKAFELLKFRTLMPANENEAATNWCIANDARLGRVGKLLRSTSLDELPQLWNVVRGDMTLVGPRPERPHFVEQFNVTVPDYSARQRVPGGLTGWAAVNGLRGDTSISSRARHDNYYIENWGLWFDTKIVLRTVSAVLTMKGG